MNNNDLIRREDAINEMREYMEDKMRIFPKQKDRIFAMELDLCTMLCTVSSVDAVEVVRCKDCIHFIGDGVMSNGRVIYSVVCMRCELKHESVRSDFFCADGESIHYDE